MIDEKVNEKLIQTAFSKKLKVHITLKNKTWRNGYVLKVTPDFFMFQDDKNDIEPFFFLQLLSVEPFNEPSKKEGEKIGK